MEFNEKALELLQTTAAKAAGATVLQIPGDGRTATIAINGAIQTVDLQPANLNQVVYTLEALAIYALNFAAAHSNNDTVVFHNENEVVLLLNNADRRDKVTLKLTASDQWTLLCDWDERKPSLAQKAVVSMLRLIFNMPPTVVDGFRKLDLRSGQVVNATIERGRESLGKNVESQIMNAADLPESIVLPAPIYKNLGDAEIYHVACNVEIDAINGLIQIVPEPLRLKEIMHRHQADIAERLKQSFSEVGADIPVYYGTP